MAAGKLAGIVPGRSLTFPGGRAVNLVLAVVAVLTTVSCNAGRGGAPVLCVLGLAALGLGVMATLPIVGADMPVVISLLNASPARWRPWLGSCSPAPC